MPRAGGRGGCYGGRRAVDVIVTHDVSDFDGIAASVAAAKLYPGAVMSRRRIVASEVRSYLAVHGDRFRFVPLQDLDQREIRRFIMVDVRRRSRLVPDFATVFERLDAGDPSLEVHVYDHHPDAEDDVRGTVEVVETMGSVTTLFTEISRDRGIPLDPVEATLLALGVHADTGSLTFAGTRPRDAQAVAWLMERGANPEVVGRFMRPRFGPAQRDLLCRFLQEMDVVRSGGNDVGIAIVALRRSVSGMPIVTTEVCRSSAVAAVFGIFPIGTRRVQVIGRADAASGDGPVHVGAVMTRLGGGGHADAGSATLRDVDAETIKTRILDALQRQTPSSGTIARLMRPAPPDLRVHKGRTLGPDATFDDAVDLMARRNLDRVPVVEDARVVGVVHRVDLMRTLYDGELSEATRARGRGRGG
jgi:tRNA nucleotidyltransferase (CCA-adding enzyme)